MQIDRDPKIREQGVDKIKALRQGSDVGDKSVCPFKVPIVNLDYIFYIDMLDWDQESVTEPILTTNLSLHELDSLKESPLKLDNYPCHCQGCERAVKETSRASAKVVGWAARDRFIRLSGLSRYLMKKFDSRQDFMDNIVD